MRNMEIQFKPIFDFMPIYKINEGNNYLISKITITDSDNSFNKVISYKNRPEDKKFKRINIEDKEVK